MRNKNRRPRETRLVSHAFNLCFMLLSMHLISNSGFFRSNDGDDDSSNCMYAFAWMILDPSSNVMLRSNNRWMVHPSTRPKNTFIQGTGADIEQPPLDDVESSTITATMTTTTTSGAIDGSVGVTATATTSSGTPGSNIPLSAAALAARNKVNEIDFCIAPADVSLSRAYGTTSAVAGATSVTSGVELSLTRALNNASNRAVRRILLSRSWPSAEALNLSLRQVAMAEKKREEELLLKQQQQETDPTKGPESESSSKCPVPRPILNVLTRQQSAIQSPKQEIPKPRSRTDQEYVNDQIQSFRERYGALPGYDFAEDYLASILSLATSGVESDRASKVLQSGLYDEAYKRVLAVLRTVGVQFVVENDGRQSIAPKLLDQDICLSMLDKIQMKQDNAKALIAHKPDLLVVSETVEEMKQQQDDTPSGPPVDSSVPLEEDDAALAIKNAKRGFMFWKRQNGAVDDGSNMVVEDKTSGENQLSGDDLGGVLLSANEPSMTRQLNVLSNIVQRALLFGGDQELLVLAETLDADKPAFIDRWYPNEKENSNISDQPGIKYLDCLIMLLRKCFTDGIVNDLNPPLPLSNSYANAYERLVASAVELGSGYMKPVVATSVETSTAMLGAGGSGKKSSLPKPRTAQEGIGQFAFWESSARQRAASIAAPASSAYPSDMEGKWEVRDEIGGKTIGSSTVTLLENGFVEVPPPLEGLRWRLDPGPTHLDTCTFQVLSTDGTVLQYRGFIDRGARLEARFSKRPIQVRGSVMFQMRDGAVAVDFYRDMLPINYRQGTTKFVMTKKAISKR